MSKVLKADASSALAYVTGPAVSANDVWISFGLYLSAAALALWTDPGSGDYASLVEAYATGSDSIDLCDPDFGAYWIAAGGSGSTPPPVALTWLDCEAHFNSVDGFIEFYINGTQVWTGSGSGGSNVTSFNLGVCPAGGAGAIGAGAIAYFRDVLVGSTRGASNLFSDDFSSGNLSAWSSETGDVSVVSSRAPDLQSVAGVYIAFGDDTLTETPNYQAVAKVQAWNSDRGRQYELDKTQAGTATVTIIDTDGTYDPTNPDSPLFGLIGPLAPAQIRIVNPVTGVTEPKFTGFVESWDYVYDPQPSPYAIILTINLTDAFELLTRAETVPDSTGTTILDADRVDDRITGILADFGWPADKELIFSGNVDLQRTVYNPQTTLLSVLQDCADAELPNAANVYIDKWGQVAFRGRFARLIPEFYSPRAGGMTPPVGPRSVIDFWEVGDRNAAETFGIAPISDIEWTLDLKNVINAVVCTPNGIGQADIAGQLVEDAASIAQYGTRVLSISDLLTLSQLVGDDQGQLALDANDACKIFGMYYVDNYAQPVEMISAISFKSRDPSDPLAGPLWDFIQGVEIGDVLKVWVTNPGGGGFRETQFFVEGVHDAVKVLRDDVFDWTMTLDLSPRAWYSVFNGRVYYIPPAVPPGSVVAAFEASPCIGPASLAVDFTDMSVPGFSGPITAWHWEYRAAADSSWTSFSTAENPSHTFPTPMTGQSFYNVKLTVTGTGADGTSSRTQVIYVT